MLHEKAKGITGTGYLLGTKRQHRILDLNIFLEYREAFRGLLARRRSLKALYNAECNPKNKHFLKFAIYSVCVRSVQICRQKLQSKMLLRSTHPVVTRYIKGK